MKARPLYTEADQSRLKQDVCSGDSKSYRSPFKKDLGRLVHSGSLRRLQGKIQLFPGVDSDYFRNRLTHSMEVAQIAKCIGARLNFEHFLPRASGTPPSELHNYILDADLLEFAGLAHDLGHPPFGHTGEEALAEKMQKAGGFEGNAQTLRIVSALDRQKLDETRNHSFGLNLTFRSLAAVLKYPTKITDQLIKTKGPVVKGYYSDEQKLVEATIRNVVGPRRVARELKTSEFKTIECAIMDLSDDIAYSTYDIEDSFHAGFLSPADIVDAWTDESLLAEILETANKALKKDAYYLGESFDACTESDIRLALFTIVREMLPEGSEVEQIVDADMAVLHASGQLDTAANYAELKSIYQLSMFFYQSSEIGRKYDLRVDVSSDLVGYFVNAVQCRVDELNPCLSKVWLPREYRIILEAVKNLTYLKIIRSHRIRVFSHRGREIVGRIFDEVRNNVELLPDSFYLRITNNSIANGKVDPRHALRVITDFIAGLTDAQAMDFYARLTSEQHRTIFAPPGDSAHY